MSQHTKCALPGFSARKSITQCHTHGYLNAWKCTTTSNKWLGRAGLQVSIEELTLAAQEQVLNTRGMEVHTHHNRQTSRCWLFNEASETIQPITAGGKIPSIHPSVRLSICPSILRTHQDSNWGKSGNKKGNKKRWID